MPKGKSKPQAGTRLPRLRGVLMVDEVNGKPRTRAWPKPRGANRNPTNQYWSGWLKAVTYLWRYQPAKFQAQLIEATKGTPWMPRDPFISAARGRAWSFTLQDGRTYYPMPVVQAVSQSLDAIAQLPGSMLFRSKNRWTSIPAPDAANRALVSTGIDTPPEWLPFSGGGGGAAGWTPLAPPLVGSPEDDEFEVPTAGVPAGWTLCDHGAVSSVNVDDAGLFMTQSVHSGTSWSGIVRPLPSGDFTIWTRVAPVGRVHNYFHTGLALWENPASASGDLATVSLRLAVANNVVEFNRWSAYNAYTSTPITSAALPQSTSGGFLRLRRTGTTYTLDFSSDGLGWVRLGSTVLATAFTHWGPALNVESGPEVEGGRWNFWRYVPADVGVTGLMYGRHAT